MRYPQLWNTEGLIKYCSEVSTCINGEWVPCRPLPFYSVTERFKLAWMVFTGKADAIVWPKGQ